MSSKQGGKVPLKAPEAEKKEYDEDSNVVQHDNMRGILEKITWVIEVVNGEEIEGSYAGFAIDHRMIMSAASKFCRIEKNRKIRGRMLQNEQGVDLQQVFMMKNWDVVIFQLPSDIRCNHVGNFAADGTLRKKQVLLHMGHMINGSYHVGRVCSPVQDVHLPPLQNYKWTCDKYKPSENIPYPILGHVWNKEVYDKYVEDTGGFELDFARDFHPHVPIIELNGFSCYERDLGGPIINTSGEIVGMIAGDGDKCIGIHVAALKEVLKRYTGSQG